jgi:hypothetical protein
MDKAISTADFLVNYNPIKVNLGVTIKKYTSKKPCIDHLKIFGYVVYLRIYPKRTKKKT